MPIIQTTSPLQSALDTLGTAAQGFTQQQQQQQQLQQQAKEFAQRKAEADRDFQLRAAAARASGYDAETGAALPSSAKYIAIPKDATTDQIVSIATRNAGIAAASQPPDEAGMDRWTKVAQTASLGYQRVASGDVAEQGTLPLDKAKIKQINYDIANGFKQKRELLEMQLDAKTRLAVQAGYRRAGGGRGGNSEADQQREAVAQATAMNMANRMTYEEAQRKAQTDYTQAMDDYRQSYNKQTGQYGQPMPVQQQVQAPPTFIVAPGPSGPTIQILQPSAPGQYVGVPQAQAPAAPPLHPSLRHGFNVGASSSGGGSAAAPSSGRIVQHNPLTGAYRHSDDGGQTWEPGP